jgi:multidrug resistance efflux pump
MKSQSKVGLCGKEVCVHICTRVCYCPVGLELSYRRLRAQQARREQRRENLRAMVDQLEANIRKAAGSFEEFSQKLARERQQKGREVICAQQQLISAGR